MRGETKRPLKPVRNSESRAHSARMRDLATTTKDSHTVYGADCKNFDHAELRLFDLWPSGKVMPVALPWCAAIRNVTGQQ